MMSFEKMILGKKVGGGLMKKDFMAPFLCFVISISSFNTIGRLRYQKLSRP